jgi:hypothetical protein
MASNKANRFKAALKAKKTRERLRKHGFMKVPKPGARMRRTPKRRVPGGLR